MAVAHMNSVAVIACTRPAQEQAGQSPSMSGGHEVPALAEDLVTTDC